jgi:hypothetical protein
MTPAASEGVIIYARIWQPYRATGVPLVKAVVFARMALTANGMLTVPGAVKDATGAQFAPSIETSIATVATNVPPRVTPK